MSTKFKFFISCEEAQHICDKSQYGEAGFWEILKLKLRLSWCHITRAYSSKNAKLTELVQKSNIDAIEQKKKDEMARKLKEEMSKY
ncbi:hypothetical protein KORDIASMS9_00139 [Kordia sp. SMS9]|uniref:hypothetical protein n=1 Tax=Kordia sp. SMS9 TaxID=2282170 RepID=UPI000E0D33A9|nr:hypothetical protein [Kordia sp. SMS9]AXG67957.1 hypothetical protein KORDIASMS9_00139 [Kordia sp. SMS9]